MIEQIRRYLPISAVSWLIVALALLFLSTQTFEPNDVREILARTDVGTVSPSREDFILPVADGELELFYEACLAELDADEPLTDPDFFGSRDCSIIGNPGDTVFYQVGVENRTEETLTNVVVTASDFGAIQPDNACWRAAIPTRDVPEPAEGWPGDEPGTLPPGTSASCVYSVTLAEDAEDPIFTDVEATFNLPALDELDAEDEDELEEMTEELIPEGTTVEAERVVRIIHDFPVVPSLWVPTFGFSSSRVIDIGAVNTGISLVIFTLGFALLEVAMAYVFRDSDDKLVRPLLRVAGVFLVFWSFYGHEIFWDNLLAAMFPNALRGGADVEILHPQNSVITFAGEHLELVIVSSFLTIPIGLLIGIFVTREDYREFLPLMTNLVNLGQTIPTLAVIAIFRPIIGLGFTPAIIALFVYGLLPVVRNTIAGLEGVDRFTIDSAKGMGMTPAQILFRIELPIASSIIMAGVRTSMVINVGTAALGAYVISGGLGIPIANGLSRQINPWILLGAIPAALLAILIDYILGRLEYVLTPRGLQIEG